ncbi:hypothetical protein KJ885_02285 [Patescibacteria group bacterium]|nr:hypothetical protein [Patescibacteria group bacterium]
MFIEKRRKPMNDIIRMQIREADKRRSREKREARKRKIYNLFWRSKNPEKGILVVNLLTIICLLTALCSVILGCFLLYFSVLKLPKPINLSTVFSAYVLMCFFGHRLINTRAYLKGKWLELNEIKKNFIIASGESFEDAIKRIAKDKKCWQEEELAAELQYLNFNPAQGAYR